MTLPFADASKLADDARARGQEPGKALSIAVVDYGGFVVLAERTDGARSMTGSIARCTRTKTAATRFAW